MQAIRLHNLADLQSVAADQWNALARGVPFRRWEWAEGWWRHYGHDCGRLRRNHELYVVALLDQGGALLGVAPWYLEQTAAHGRTLRFLGSGDVCSEYLSLLCREGAEDAVAATLAQWLTERNVGPDRWDSLRLAPVEGPDLATGRLVEQLAAWALREPAAGHELLAALLARKLGPISGRKIEIAPQTTAAAGSRLLPQRPSRDALGPRAKPIGWHAGTADRAAPRASGGLADRRAALAAPASSNFTARSRRTCLLRAACNSAGSSSTVVRRRRSTTSADQIRCMPINRALLRNLLNHQPGHLSNLATIRRAIERGDRAVDFLRGDEPYKAHWGAVSRPMAEYRVVSTRLAARLRQGLWTAGGNMVGWLKSGWQLAENLVTE